MIKRSFRWATGFSLAVLSSAALFGAADVPLLERTGERVKTFWDQLSSVASTENVLQEKLNPKGKVILNHRTKYDYMITMRWANGGMLVDESRLAMEQGRKKPPQGTLLTTQGFATLLLVFHPQFQSSYTFVSTGEPGSKLVRIDFSARNGAPSPAVLSLKGRDYPIGWEGSAWIDPALAMVTRIVAHWKQPPGEIGLEELSSEVIYSPTAFRGSTQTFWLPATAKVEVKTQHQHWRNTHEFSGYRLFSVDADSTPESSPEPAKSNSVKGKSKP